MQQADPIKVIVTPGDPAGIGPFVMYRAWRALGEPRDVAFAGPRRLWAAVAARLGGPEPRLLQAEEFDLPIPPPGRPDANGALLAWRSLDAAIDAAGRNGAALATGPVSKEYMLAAGFPYAGHTDYLKQQFEADAVLMVMSAGAFVVGLATVHVPLRDVPVLVTQQRIGRAIRLLHTYLDLTDADRQLPLAVAGLNPHAGEHGTLGDEEQVIRAAIEEVCGELPRAVIGPLPGDTIFRELQEGRVAAVLAMYHDQGLAPFKLLHFDCGVNVTVGLPVLRTSPDHGTAFDLAPGDRASSRSAEAALSFALNYGPRWASSSGTTDER